MKHQNIEFYVVQAKRRAAWTSTAALDSNWQEALRRWPRTSQCRCGVLWRAWLTLMSTLWLSVALRCGRDCPHWGILLSSFIGVPSHSCSFCSTDTCSLERWNKWFYLHYYGLLHNNNYILLLHYYYCLFYIFTRFQWYWYNIS